MRTNESAVYTTENKGRFNWRLGENREGHYSDPLNLMWTKTWSMSITWLSKCAMEINITHKKLKIPWGHVSLPHTKGHGYDLSILIEICTVQHKLMHGTWEIYLHEQPTVCSACHSNSVHTLRERKKKRNKLVQQNGILSGTICSRHIIFWIRWVCFPDYWGG